MTVEEVAKELGLEVLVEGDLSVDVTGGYCADLLSEVLAHARRGDLWITHQKHLNVVAVAKMREVAGVVLVRGLRPAQDVLERARAEGVNVLVARERAFEVAGRLYRLLFP